MSKIVSLFNCILCLHLFLLHNNRKGFLHPAYLQRWLAQKTQSWSGLMPTTVSTLNMTLDNNCLIRYYPFLNLFRVNFSSLYSLKTVKKLIYRGFFLQGIEMEHWPEMN